MDDSYTASLGSNQIRIVSRPNNVWNGLEHVRTHEYVVQSLVDAVELNHGCDPPSEVLLGKRLHSAR